MPAFFGCLGPRHAAAQVPTGSGAQQSARPTVNLGTIPVTAAAPLTIGQQPNAEGINNYVVTRQRTGGKADLPNSSIAQDVVTVPLKVIQDQADTSPRQALENVAGVSSGGYTRIGIYDGFELVRGFAPTSFLRNGFFDETSGTNTYLPWAGDLERIDVLKGASALLYGPAGAGGIGGIINVVTKQPLLVPSYTMGGGVDSFGGWSVNVDLSQPLNPEKTWLARFIGEVNDQATWIDHFRIRQQAGDLTTQGLIDPNTKLTVTAEWIHQEDGQYYGYPAYGSILPAPKASPFQRFSESFNAFDPSAVQFFDAGRLQAIVEHRFDEDWALRVSLAYSYGDRDNPVSYIQPAGNYATTGLWTEQYNHTVFQSQTYSEDTTLLGRFNTFGRENQAVFGLQVVANQVTVTNKNGLFTPKPALSPTLLWNQSYGREVLFNHSHPNTTELVLYANDIISLTDRLKFSAGVSFVDASLNGTFQVPAGKPSYNVTQQGAATRVGPIFELVKNVFLFADYATAFVPATPVLQSNGTVYSNYSPLTGNQIEAGVKWEVPDRASVTAAAYQLTENNVLTSDPVNPNVTIQSGEQRSRGLELDGAYRLAPGWDLLTALAYTYAEVTKDNTLLTGSSLTNVPKYSGRIFSTYEFPLGPGTFGFGGGVTFATTRTADIPTRVAPTVGYIPGYGRVDALAYYKIGGWRASLNIINLLNTRYEENAQNLSRVYSGQPFSAFFRASKEF